jgi:hypothetical protein
VIKNLAMIVSGSKDRKFLETESLTYLLHRSAIFTSGIILLVPFLYYVTSMPDVCAQSPPAGEREIDRHGSDNVRILQ